MISRIKSEKDDFESEVARSEESTADMLEEIRRNKFKIAAIKKDKTEITKV